MSASTDIVSVGVNDRKIDLFEGQFAVPEGMAYNSYVLKDEKIAVFDTVDAAFGAEWLENVRRATEGRQVDYLIVQHMEPDHSANIAAFMERYPGAKIVASAAAFPMMKNFFGTDYAANRVIVKEGDRLETGRHALRFVSAPMVHWPEVTVTYDETTRTLFSADAFGKFGAQDAANDEGWDCEARRYYFGIVGKFGAQVQALLAKAAKLDIRRICPLHGPVLETAAEIGHAVALYDTWSRYAAETKGVFVAYTSVYGHTRAVAEELVRLLAAKGVKVAVADLARSDVYEAVEDAFRYSALALATTTYNMGVFPKMREFIEHLTARNFQNRCVGFVENGSWAPSAAKKMKEMLSASKDLAICPTTVTVRGAMAAATGADLARLAEELAAGANA